MRVEHYEMLIIHLNNVYIKMPIINVYMCIDLFHEENYINEKIFNVSLSFR